MNNPKITVIIPAYNNEENIKKCVNSVLSQTYKNIEIIIIDDKSTDKSLKIIEQIRFEHPEIILLCHNSHKGLYRTRIDAIANASGDYIAMVGGGDYISRDYFRTIMYVLIESNADIAISDIIEEVNDGRRTIPSLAYNNIQFGILRNNDILNRYFEQEGLNSLWSIIESKICKKEIWDKSLPYLVKRIERITTAENIIFSSVLMYFAKKVIKVSNAPYYYCGHINPSDILYSHESLQVAISDTTKAFLILRKFLSDIKANRRYIGNITKWESLYYNIYSEYVNTIICSKSKRNGLQDQLSVLSNKGIVIENPYYFYQVQTDWNDGLEKLKEQIIDPGNEIISFDIFDTLVLRPLYNPTDLFELMNDNFYKITGGTFSDFSSIRIEAEHKARQNLRNSNSKFEEITLEYIYDVMINEYKISRTIVHQMYHTETKLEIKYCRTRKSTQQLYELARYINKEIIIVSDMYLPKSVIEEILKRNKYNHYKKLYVSSEYKLTKSVSSLYEYVISDSGKTPDKILHIGDNHKSDYQNAIKYNINAIHYPSTKDIFANNAKDIHKLFFKNLPFWQNNTLAANDLTIRVFLALMVNKYFDNPYMTFNSCTDFNCDPKFIGYGAFGMFLFGLNDWLIRDTSRKKYNKIAFMSRDGYMPMRAYYAMAPYYNLSSPKGTYFYTSRQANLFATIKNEYDIFKLDEVIMKQNKTPKQLAPFLANIFEGFDINKLDKLLREEHKSINDIVGSKSEFWELIRLCKEHFFDAKKNIKRTNLIKKYINDQLGDNFCIFDIGYSAKPEMYLSKLLDKEVDAYFVHGDISSGKHSVIGGFELNTYYDYTPQIYALLDELLLSKRAGTCAAYGIVNRVVNPILNKYDAPYQESSVVRDVQESALQIIRDVLCIVDVNTTKSNQKFYYSMMYNSLLQSSNKTDMLTFTGVRFKDDVFSEDRFDLVGYWRILKARRNQHTLSEIYNIPYSDSQRVEFENK